RPRWRTAYSVLRSRDWSTPSGHLFMGAVATRLYFIAMSWPMVRSCVIAFAALVLAAPASGASLEAQREAYVQARAALAAGDEAGFQARLPALAGYVLEPYARYAWLEKRIERVPDALVREFLQRYDYTPLPDALRRDWLRALAARGAWDEFVRAYRDGHGDDELTCEYLARRLEAGERTAAIMERIDELWHRGRRLPGACNAVFAAWRDAGHMTADKVWERIRLAMQAGSVSLARELAARYLPPEDEVWMARWVRMH